MAARRRACAYSIEGRILIAPTQIASSGVPLIGSPCFDGPFVELVADTAILEALEQSLKLWPGDPDPRTLNRNLLKSFRIRSLKAFHAADSVSIEQDANGMIVFCSDARHPEGGFVASTEASLRVEPDPVELGHTLLAALRIAPNAKPV